MLCFDWLIRLIPSNVQFVGAGCMHRFFRGAVKICQVSKCPKGECQNSDVSWHQCSLSLFVCLCAFERPICYTFSWDWSMDRNETPARDSNHGIPCGEKCWFLAWKRLWPNSGAFELGHQFQELTSLIFFWWAKWWYLLWVFPKMVGSHIFAPSKLVQVSLHLWRLRLGRSGRCLETLGWGGERWRWGTHFYIYKICVLNVDMSILYINIGNVF